MLVSNWFNENGDSSDSVGIELKESFHRSIRSSSHHPFEEGSFDESEDDSSMWRNDSSRTRSSRRSMKSRIPHDEIENSSSAEFDEDETRGYRKRSIRRDSSRMLDDKRRRQSNSRIREDKESNSFEFDLIY